MGARVRQGRQEEGGGRRRVEAGGCLLVREGGLLKRHVYLLGACLRGLCNPIHESIANQVKASCCDKAQVGAGRYRGRRLLMAYQPL